MKKRYCLSFLIALWGAQAAVADVSVFSCEPEWKALAEEIGGDRIRAVSATTAAQDPHHIQARPSLIARLRRADLLICSGANLEAGWLPVLLRRARNPRVQPGQPGHLLAADQVGLLEIPETLDRREGHVHAQGNPHLQLDPRRLIPVARVLSERLGAIDSDQEGFYQARFEQFRKQWSGRIADWEEQAAVLRGRSVVVHHRDWVYLLDWLGMTELAALEPKPGVPPTAGHLARLQSRLSGEKPLAILRSPISQSGPSEWLSGRTGIPQLVLPHTVGSMPGAGALGGLFDTLVSGLVQVGR